MPKCCSAFHKKVHEQNAKTYFSINSYSTALVNVRLFPLTSKGGANVYVSNSYFSDKTKRLT